MTTLSQERSDIVMYLIVRNDLKMSKGKIAAQCGHGVQYAIKACDDSLYQNYQDCGCAKLCLKVETREEFIRLRFKLSEAGIKTFTVVDAGHTQVEPNTETCFAVGPVTKETMKDFVKDLKLL